MYKIYVDNELFCDSSINELAIINPVVTLEANTAGQFTFTIPSTHPYYDNIQRLTSVIEVCRENKIVFRGFVSGDEKDLWNNRHITCEGDLSYLNDSILRPHKYQGETVLSLLTAYINEHNSQVEDRKKFSMGVVTVTDPNDYIYCFTNMNSAMTEIKEDLIDDLGGYLRLRYPLHRKNLFDLTPFQTWTVHDGYGYAGAFYLKPNTQYTISSYAPSNTSGTLYFNTLDVSVEESGFVQTITTDSTGVVWIWIINNRPATENYRNGTYKVYLVEGAEEYSKKYIDYIREQDFPTANQIIELGVNLINYKSNIDDIDLCTRIVPLGNLLEEQEIEGLDTRLTIEGQPTSSTHKHTSDDYLESTSAVNNFGVITKTVTFDDVTTASMLVTKGNKYLSENQFESLVIEVSAVDLGLIDRNVNTWELLQQIRVKSPIHGLDAYFPLTKMVLDLSNPENDTFTLGTKSKLKSSLTAKTTEASATAKKVVDNVNKPAWLAQAQQNALNMLLDETQGGHVIFEYEEDANHQPLYVKAISVCDTDKISTSLKRWRWSENGFGFMSRTSTSSDWSTLKVALTPDGTINADRILTGTLRSREIANGGTSTSNAPFRVDTNGNLTATNATIKGSISSSTISGGTISGTSISGGSVSGTDIYGGTLSVPKTTPLFKVYSNGKVDASAINITGGNILLARDNVVSSSPTLEIQGSIQGAQTRSVLSSAKLDCYAGSNNPLSLSRTGLSMNESSTKYVTLKPSFLHLNDSNTSNEKYIHFSPLGHSFFGSTGNFSVDCNFAVTGGHTKSRAVDTDSYDTVLLYSYETPKPTFADEGHGKLDENGVCYIYLDNVFLETIDQTHRYRVFLTKYGQGDIWVEEVEKTWIVVHGTPELEFDWKVDCIQRDFNYANLEKIDNREDEEEADYIALSSQYIYDSQESDFIKLTNKYLQQYEREVLADESNY